MQIKPSSILRNDYNGLSTLAHETKEPIFITKNGEGDLVVMSIEAYEARERQLEHRARMLESRYGVLSGEATYSLDDVNSQMKERFFNGSV